MELVINWDELAEATRSDISLLPNSLLKGNTKLGEEDQEALWDFYSALRTRVGHAALGHRSGEVRSVYEHMESLLSIERDICQRFGRKASVFASMADHFLDNHLRWFYSKWRVRVLGNDPLSMDQRGLFIADLRTARTSMRSFAKLIAKVVDATDCDPHDFDEAQRTTPIIALPPIILNSGPPAETSSSGIGFEEHQDITHRRSALGADVPLASDSPQSSEYLGLALSGGGIRSATVCMGVMQAMNSQRWASPQAVDNQHAGQSECEGTYSLFDRVDYLSTASGGGFVGSWLTTNLGAKDHAHNPLGDDGRDTEAVRHVRQRSKYLASGALYGLFLLLTGILAHALIILPVVFFVACACMDKVFRVGTDPANPIVAGLTHLPWALASLLAVGVGVHLLKPRLRRMPGTRSLMAKLPSLKPIILWPSIVLALIAAHVGAVQLSRTGMVLELAWIVPLILSGIALIGFIIPKPKIGRVLTVTSLSLLFPSFAITAFILLKESIQTEMAVLAVEGQSWHHLKTPGVWVGALACGIVAPFLWQGKTRTLCIILWLGFASLIAIGFFSEAHSDRPVFSYGLALSGLCTLVGLVAFNLNSTSPAAFYKKALADAYLIHVEQDKQGGDGSARGTPLQGDEVAESPIKNDAALLLSEMNASGRAPYQLITAAVNVPSSENLDLYWRKSDVFLFSKYLCGSRISSYCDTKDLERRDPDLDMATALGMSGAAVSPHMGRQSSMGASSLLTLLNIRLGYYLPNPGRNPGPLEGLSSGPGLVYLIKELAGALSETDSYLNVSDGGHIENLGVYELLRRQARVIISVDAECDPQARCSALLDVIRLASLDLGIDVDINIDDILADDNRLSRSHFAVGTIRYPQGQTGIFIYVKASMSGDEHRTIRHFQDRNPEFPHQTTADQFFDEDQFEAYRALGFHIGQQLFAPALVGENSGSVREWLSRLCHTFELDLPTQANAPLDQGADSSQVPAPRPNTFVEDEQAS